MTTIRLPYGAASLTLEIGDNNLLQIIEPHELKPTYSEAKLFSDALKNPLGTARLYEIAAKKCAEKGADNVTAAIAVDDNTRPCPTDRILPYVLDELHKAGVKKERVTIIFATGSHRTVKKEEAENLLGKEIAASYRYVSNDAKGDDFTFVGETSKGTKVTVKKVFADADVKILTGDVELHYFAGYGGGRKSVLPGICGYAAIQHNYKTNFFHQNSRSGLLDGNPMHENMTEAAHLAKIDFTLNVVQNASHEIIGVFAGEFDVVLRKGAALIDAMYKVQIKEKADIVIAAADGLPHDVNLYQAYKAIHFALNAAKNRGVIILVAECRDGYENQAYYDAMRSLATVEEVEKELKREFTPGVHKAWFNLTALKKIHVIAVTSMPKDEIENVFKFEYAASVESALRRALELKGPTAKITVMPHGSTTLVVR